MKKDRIKQNNKGEDVCSRCDETVSYSDEFDTFYCDNCNLWLEERCVDPLCDVCPKRPIRPLKKPKPEPKKKNKIAIDWEIEK